MTQNLVNFSTIFKYNGLSKQKIIIIHNKVFKFIKLDLKTTKIINWLLVNNNSYLPNINVFKDYISYDLIDGYTFEEIGFTGILELKNILLVIKNLQKLKYKKKYIVHGDLSPVNIIFRQNLMVKKIIDWDNVKLGTKYQDPAYVFWLWINFGGDNKTFSQLKQEANIFKNTLYYNPQDLKKLKRWILKVIKDEMKKHFFQIKNNVALLKWYLRCLEWVKNEWEKLWI